MYQIPTIRTRLATATSAQPLPVVRGSVAFIGVCVPVAAGHRLLVRYFF